MRSFKFRLFSLVVCHGTNLRGFGQRGFASLGLTVGILLLVLGTASASLATIHYVTNAGELIQAVLDAETGDIIELAEGSYHVPSALPIRVGLTMRGATGDPADVRLFLLNLTDGIIDSDNFQGDYSVSFEGLTFKHFLTYNLPLLRHDSLIELKTCIFEECRTPSLIVENGGLTVENCIFQNNEVTNLIVASENISLADCSFQGNTTEFLILQEYGNLAMSQTNLTNNIGVCIYMAPNSALISNCSFTANTGGNFCVNTHIEATLEMTDCTFHDNIYTSGVLKVQPLGEAVLIDCEIMNNGTVEGTLMYMSNTQFICCELDLGNWILQGEYVVDNSNCSVGTTLQSFDGLKALYR